jgi:conjugative transfer region protein (TIGR03750 family)
MRAISSYRHAKERIVNSPQEIYMLNHINHKMPIYKDCTLFELLAVSISYLIVFGSLLSLCSWILFGYASIGCAITLFSMVHASRFLLGRLQKVKYGKPYGYYKHLFLKKIANIQGVHMFYTSPWIVRKGRWSVRRTAHET